MSKRKCRPYAADPTPPGATIEDWLNERDLYQADLARMMGRPIKTINEIVRGKARITPETALQLEQALKIPAEFWLTREGNYRLGLLRLKARKQK